MKVSITVVTYNHGQWLAECLESLIRQETDFPFEILIGDDASTDGVTPGIAKSFHARYPQQIRLFLRSANIGADANAFDLIRQAKGEYVAHMDGDDVAFPKKLQTQADFLDAQMDCVCVGHRMVMMTADGNHLRQVPRILAHARPITLSTRDLILSASPFPNSSIMFRKEIHRDPERQDRQFVSDFYLHVQRSLTGSIVKIPQVLGAYRRGVGLASKIANLPTLLQNALAACDLAETTDVSAATVAVARRKHRLHFCLTAARAGDDVLFARMLFSWKASRFRLGWLATLLYACRHQRSVIRFLAWGYFALQAGRDRLCGRQFILG